MPIEPRLYRTWLYNLGRPIRRGSRRQRKARGGPVRILTAREAAKEPSRPRRDFARELLAWRPDANPDKYWWWRQQVFGQAGRRCQRCGASGRNAELHAHHIRSWRDWPKHRYDPTNGLCLCKACHEAEHGRTFDGRQTVPATIKAEVRRMVAPILSQYGFRGKGKPTERIEGETVSLPSTKPEPAKASSYTRRHLIGTIERPVIVPQGAELWSEVT